jgi:uncharacterized protein
MRRFNLRSLRFGDASETWRRVPVEVDPFVFGGEEYRVAGGAVDVLLTATRVDTRLTLMATFEARLHGPCQRCLEEVDLRVSAEGEEYVRDGESEQGGEDEEPYVAAHTLDLDRWVRDLLAGALPLKLVCCDDCRGLCQVCGANLNRDPDHTHEAS